MATSRVLWDGCDVQGPCAPRACVSMRSCLPACLPARLPACLPAWPGGQVPYQVELVKFSTDNDSIGAIVCKRAEQLQAAAVVMAKHNKGAIKEFFVGSVCNYCTHHAKVPVLVMQAD